MNGTCKGSETVTPVPAGALPDNGDASTVNGASPDTREFICSECGVLPTLDIKAFNFTIVNLTVSSAVNEVAKEIRPSVGYSE